MSAYAPEAWIDHTKTKIGYEIPFTRHFYEYVPPRPLAEIDAELLETENRIQELLGGFNDDVRRSSRFARISPNGTSGDPNAMTASLLPDRLPEGWRGARLRWVSRIYAGGTPSRERPEYWHEGTIPWLNSGAVNNWAINKPSEYITGAGLAGSSARWIPSSSVVMALAGQGKTKGTAARLEIETTCNQSMAALVPGQMMDYRFLHFWLVANYERIRNIGGGDLRDGLNLQMVGDIEIPLPPVEEQRRIAEFLDDQVARIDELTDARHRQRDLLQERLRVVRDSVVDGVRVAIRRVTSLLRDGTHASVPRVDEGVPLLSVRNIQDGVFEFREDDSFVSYEDYVAIDSACPARRGDVLLAIVGATLGKTALVELDEPFCLQRSVAVLRPRPETLSAAWLLNALRTTEVQDQLWLAAGFSAQPGVYLGTVADLRIPVPDLSTQTEALDFLRNYESQIGRAALEQTLAARQLEERKRSLITAAVTGELDVTTAKPIGMGKWVPNIGAGVEAPAAAQARSIGGIG